MKFTLVSAFAFVVTGQQNEEVEILEQDSEPTDSLFTGEIETKPLWVTEVSCF